MIVNGLVSKDDSDDFLVGWQDGGLSIALPGGILPETMNPCNFLGAFLKEETGLDICSDDVSILSENREGNSWVTILRVQTNVETFRADFHSTTVWGWAHYDDLIDYFENSTKKAEDVATYKALCLSRLQV